jgi:hypothetical protein
VVLAYLKSSAHTGAGTRQFSKQAISQLLFLKNGQIGDSVVVRFLSNISLDVCSLTMSALMPLDWLVAHKILQSNQ